MFFNILSDVFFVFYQANLPNMYDLYILNEKFFIVVLSRSLFLCLFCCWGNKQTWGKKALDAEN